MCWGWRSGDKRIHGNFAWVFYHRIRITSTKLEMDDWQLLGHVIAHELGHLVLRSPAHSVSGVMRAAWDRTQVINAAAGLLTFTPSQVSIISRHLSDFR